MVDVVVYVSGHGFGHAVRSAEVCRALLRQAPEIRVQVRTEAPAWLFPPGVQVVRRRLDVGVVQPDSLRIDPSATLARYAAHVSDEDRLIAAEAAELQAAGAQLVVADVPSAAFVVAERAGVPGVGVANFSWDWIYEPYVADEPAHAPLLDRLRVQYGRATCLLRLPFHGDLSAFPRIEDVPLIARRSRADRATTRRALGLPLDVPVVLLSFGGHAFGGPDAARLRGLDRFAFVTTVPTGGPRAEGNLLSLPPLGDEYVDLLAACDVVITKPGYGIVADVLANRVPALYVSRPGFREEPILARALEVEGRALELPGEALEHWDLGSWLDRLLALDRPWSDRALDGADVAARRLRMELGRR